MDQMDADLLDPPHRPAVLRLENLVLLLLWQTGPELHQHPVFGPAVVGLALTLTLAPGLSLGVRYDPAGAQGQSHSRDEGQFSARRAGTVAVDAAPARLERKEVFCAKIAIP